VRVDRFHQLIPFLPKAVPDLFGDIQPPTVDAVGRIPIAIRVHPAPGDGENVGLDLGVQGSPALFIRHLGKFRQAFVAIPTGPVELLALLGARVVPGEDRVPILVFGLFLFLPDVGKGKKPRRRVVEHPVDDHPHAARMGLLEELEKQLVGGRPSPGGRIGGGIFEEFHVGGGIGTEKRIHVVKHEGIVFVHGGRGKDRIEIEGGHTEILEVIELVDHTLKIAAVAAVVHATIKIGSEIPFPLVHRVPLLGPSGGPPFGSDLIRHPGVFRGGVVLRIPVAEALREDLIPDRLLRPIGIRRRGRSLLVRAGGGGFSRAQGGRHEDKTKPFHLEKMPPEIPPSECGNRPLSPSRQNTIIAAMAVSESEIQSSPAERALVLGIRLFRLVGVILLAFFLVETFSSLLDLQLRNPASELRFSSQMADRIPLGLLGMALLLCHPRFLRRKPEAVALRILSILPLIVAGCYLLLIPLTMIAAASYFRNVTANLGQQAEEQAKKIRAVRDATLSLAPEQQEAMVERYNQGNPKKPPLDLPGFLKTLQDEVKASESRLEQERRSVIGSQERNLYSAQFFQSLKILAGAVAFFLLWKMTGWARPLGQMALGSELGIGRHRHNTN